MVWWPVSSFEGWLPLKSPPRIESVASPPHRNRRLPPTSKPSPPSNIETVASPKPLSSPKITPCAACHDWVMGAGMPGVHRHHHHNLIASGVLTAYFSRRRSDDTKSTLCIHSNTTTSCEPKEVPPTWFSCPSFHILVKSNKELIIMRINPAVACLRCRACVVIILITIAGDEKMQHNSYDHDCWRECECIVVNISIPNVG